MVHTPPLTTDLSGVRADSYCRWMEDKQLAILFSQEVSKVMFTFPWRSRFCAKESESCLFALLQFWSPEKSSLYVIVTLIHISGFFLFSPIYSIFLESLLPTQSYSVSSVIDTNNPMNLLILFSVHPVARGSKNSSLSWIYLQSTSISDHPLPWLMRKLSFFKMETFNFSLVVFQVGSLYSENVFLIVWESVLFLQFFLF